MRETKVKIHQWLLPLSWLYRLAVGLRNQLFTLGVLKTRSFDTPVIAVGNLTVGGTGKTPHVEYLIRLLHDKVKVAVLSRGYKRKSKGFVLAGDETTASEIGDELFQVKNKFGNIHVAACKNRCEGIDKLTDDSVAEGTDVIILDDAFQHRYVKPGINILLVDYNRPLDDDRLLPAGRLREPKESKSRADMVIITKCPKDLKAIDFRVITKTMNLFPYQDLFFTTLCYGSLYKLFGDGQRTIDSLNDTNVLLLTGIASPNQMRADLQDHCASLKQLAYSDHHNFRAKDAATIERQLNELPQPRIIVTTEKDAARLRELNTLSDEVRKAIFVLPIEVKFMLGQEEYFNEKIISYVRKNSKNSTLTKKKKDDKKPRKPQSATGPRTISFINN